MFKSAENDYRPWTALPVLVKGKKKKKYPLKLCKSTDNQPCVLSPKVPLIKHLYF